MLCAVLVPECGQRFLGAACNQPACHLSTDADPLPAFLRGPKPNPKNLSAAPLMVDLSVQDLRLQESMLAALTS